MQSFIAFCSLCLQLSSLISQDPEFLLKKDQACTLCLADVLQPTNATSLNKSSTEILNDGLYFNNPLLQEALKFKVEQQFLSQSSEYSGVDQQTLECEPLSKHDEHGQIDELIKTLVEKIEKLPSTQKQVKEGLEKQRDLIIKIIRERTDFAKYIFGKAKADAPNKPKLPADLYHLLSDIDQILPEIEGKVLHEQFMTKLSEFSEQFIEDLQNLKQRIQALESTKNQTYTQDFLQDISLLYSQAIIKLEQQSKLEHQLNQESILNNADEKLRNITKHLSSYLKPIKTSLKAGETLAVDERISSENGIFSLVLEKDLTVNLYRFKDRVWGSNKFFDAARSYGIRNFSPKLVLDPEDGVLKIQETVSGASNSLNSMSKDYISQKNYGVSLIITNRGQIVIQSGSGFKLWTPLYTVPAPNVITLSSSFNDLLLVSKNERYTLVVYYCALELLEASNPIWFFKFSSTGSGRDCRDSFYTLILSLFDSHVLPQPAIINYRDHSSLNRSSLNHFGLFGRSLTITDDGMLAILDKDAKL